MMGRQVEPSAIIEPPECPDHREWRPAQGRRRQTHQRPQTYIVTTQGFLLVGQVQGPTSSIRTAPWPLLRASRQRFSKLRHIFADRVYRPQPRAALESLDSNGWSKRTFASLPRSRPAPRTSRPPPPAPRLAFSSLRLLSRATR